jgi:adenylate cyclase class 2
LKARDADPRHSLEACEALGVEAKGVLTQQDIYFNVPHGRLKLRREKSAAPHLIAYERSSDPSQRESRYRIVEVGDDQQLEAALSGTLGVIAVVTKARRLFVSEDVRIHLDHVDGLGSFIELEAVAATEAVDLAGYETQLNALRQAFRISDANLIGESYCDLALAAVKPGGAEQNF